MNSTIIYTNWRRAAQLQTVVEAALLQSTAPQVWVVDNAAGTRHEYHGKAHRMIYDDNRLKCWRRWQVAREVDTRFVCIMDDDLTFVRQDTIERCELYMQEHPQVEVIGAFGVTMAPRRTYWQSQHHRAFKEDRQVSIIKGRFMFMRAASVPEVEADGYQDTCDDICISYHTGMKVLPAFMRGALSNLVEGAEALHASPFQQEKRNRAAAYYATHT